MLITTFCCILPIVGVQLGSELSTFAFAQKLIGPAGEVLRKVGAQDEHIPLLVQSSIVAKLISTTILEADGNFIRFPDANNMGECSCLDMFTHDSGVIHNSARITKTTRRGLHLYYHLERSNAVVTAPSGCLAVLNERTTIALYNSLPKLNCSSRFLQGLYQKNEGFRTSASSFS